MSCLRVRMLVESASLKIVRDIFGRTQNTAGGRAVKQSPELQSSLVVGCNSTDIHPADFLYSGFTRCPAVRCQLDSNPVRGHGRKNLGQWTHCTSRAVDHIRNCLGVGVFIDMSILASQVSDSSLPSTTKPKVISNLGTSSASSHLRFR